MKRHYQIYRSYIKKRFGKPVLKVAINAGFSCPNRDGTLSREGCAFCDNRAFSPVALDNADVCEQLQRAIDRAARRFDIFIAYLQPYTNTYGPVSYLQSCYEPLIAHEKVIGLAVGTRPDCLDSEICTYLADVSKRTYLSIELGLQSADDAILKRVNRGHTYAQFEEACVKLAKLDIETVAHVVLGLPGDTVDSIRATAHKLSQLPVHGVKIHQLMIIDGTALAGEYRQGRIQALSLDQYAEYVAMFLQHLRADQYIHRLVADTRLDKGLLAPLWSTQKAKALVHINRYLEEHDIFQGQMHSLP
jgi:radical SAM protein (TIGR01212 family)